MKKFVLKMGETGFQKAETRFQNAKTVLSRIFFARNGMDSAQKKPGAGCCYKPLIKIQRKVVMKQYGLNRSCLYSSALEKSGAL